MIVQARFLLPFTHIIDLGALAYAVQFVHLRQGVLVPLALIPLTAQQWAKGPRLETIEQANDFLEAVKCQARRAGVTFESSANETRDVVSSIDLFAQEFLCEGILLFLRDTTTVLLSPDVVARLLEQTAHKIYLIRLSPSMEGKVGALLRTWSSRLFARRSRPDPLPRVPAVPVGDVIAVLPVRGAASLHGPEERTR